MESFGSVFPCFTFAHLFYLQFYIIRFVSFSFENKWIQTSLGAIPANCFRIRCVFPQPIHVAIGQTISGKARFVAVTDQSYTIEITMTGSLLSFVFYHLNTF